MGIIHLPYGNKTIPLKIRDISNTKVYLPDRMDIIEHPLEEMRKILRHPNGTKPLDVLLYEKQPQKIVIVVNDETRPTPYHIFLPPLLEVFSRCGIPDKNITFIIATGLHKAHDKSLNIKIFSSDMVKRFRFVSHNAYDRNTLVDLGFLPSGIPFKINKWAVEADFLITLGVVVPHYFAGFSGGRKSILPGLAGHETIEKNHARMLEVIDDLPAIQHNPISLEMIWAARKVGVDFILNAVVTDNHEIVHLAGGDLESAWYEATQVSKKLYEIYFDDFAELCIVSASGYPRDVNMYQSQKALEHADRITRDGGHIIMLSESPQGFGEPVFEQWMSRGMQPRHIMEAIRSNFVMGGHKAYGFSRVAARKKMTFVTSISEEDTHKLFAAKSYNIQHLYDTFSDAHPHAHIAILPQGGTTVPVYIDR